MYDRPSMKSAVALMVMFAAFGISGIAGAQESRPESRAKKPRVDPSVVAHQQAVDTLKAGLIELAAWCQKMKLDRERARMLDLVLVFDPENEAAREGLGYVKAKAGGWERGGKWKEPGNRDAEALNDFKKKKADLAGVFLDEMAKIIEENRRDLEPAHKARMISDMNAVDSNDPRSKRASGEEQAGGKWVLAETAARPARKKQIEGWVKAAIAAVGTPEPAEAMGDENTFDIKWTAIVTTENLRVMGTGSKDEITKIAVLCQAAGEVFSKVFEVDVPHIAAYRVPIYILADAGSKANMLRNNKGIKPEERDHVAKLGGTYANGAHIVWPAEGITRIDLAVRQMFGGFLGRMFGIDGNEEGALYEGLALHLTWYLTNTRLTWTVGKRKYAQTGKDGLEEKLRGDSDWFAPGFELWAGKNPPPLRPLLAKHVNDLETEELLASYMLAVWLIDGRKDDAPRFLRAAGRNMLEEGSRQAFGLELNQLEERLVRWAKENRGK
jgi:hypothetical protein